MRGCGGEGMSKKMYENVRLSDSMSMNIFVSMSRNLSIGMSKSECEPE